MGASAGDLEAFAAPRWLPAWCLLVTFLAYVAFVPRFLLYSSPPTGDQPFYLMDTISLVQDHDLNVRNNYANRDEDKFYRLAPHPPGFVGIPAPYPLPPQIANSVAPPRDEWYAFHLPGLSILLVPAWVIGSWFSLWWPATVVFMCLVGALVALNILLLAGEVSQRTWVAMAVWLPLAFSNPLMTYSYLLFTELPVGLLLIYTFRRLALGWQANGPWRRLLIGVCIAYIPWLAWRCLLLAATLSAYAAIQWWRSVRVGQISEAPGSTRQWTPARLRDTVVPASPAVVSAYLLLAYNEFLYGKPAPDTRVPELGNQYPFHWPWAGAAQLAQFVTNAFGMLFDRQMGLLPFAPVYLLAAVGVIAIVAYGRPADRRLLVAMALITAPYVTAIAAFEFWHGIWCPPARYLTTLVPLAAAPLAVALTMLRRSWLFWSVYALLAAAGTVFMLAVMSDALMMWPNYPLFLWLRDAPDSPLHVDLWSHLPVFVPPDDPLLPSVSGRAIGLSFVVVALCSLPLVRRPFHTVESRRPLVVHGLLVGTALFALAGGWYVMSYDYLQSTTQLVQQARLSVGPPPWMGHLG